MKLQKLFLIASCATLLSACTESKFPTNPGAPKVAGCHGNPYLERYACSLERLTAAARNGDPDAQYGLGYMYYYGIGTMRDETTARSWIRRAAAQGQPLAVKAYSMMTGQQYSPPNTRAKVSSKTSTSAVAIKKPRTTMRQAPEELTPAKVKKPNTSVNEQLPAYRGKKAASTQNTAKATPPLTQEKVSANPQQKAEAMGQTGFVTKMSSAERWMMNNAGKHYSLQLMGSHDVKAIQKFIAKNHLEGKAHYYSADLQGQKWYMLVYGNFNSEKQAEHAAKKLSKDLRERHPWVKSYAEIQKEIKDREIS